jgi:hypothetical protein
MLNDFPGGGHTMTICPIAIVAGCRRCPAFSVCPLKGVIGDHVKADPPAKAPAMAGKAKRPTKDA